MPAMHSPVPWSVCRLIHEAWAFFLNSTESSVGLLGSGLHAVAGAAAKVDDSDGHQKAVKRDVASDGQHSVAGVAASHVQQAEARLLASHVVDLGVLFVNDSSGQQRICTSNLLRIEDFGVLAAELEFIHRPLAPPCLGYEGNRSISKLKSCHVQDKMLLVGCSTNIALVINPDAETFEMLGLKVHLHLLCFYIQGSAMIGETNVVPGTYFDLKFGQPDGQQGDLLPQQNANYLKVSCNCKQDSGFQLTQFNTMPTSRH